MSNAKKVSSVSAKRTLRNKRRMTTLIVAFSMFVIGVYIDTIYGEGVASQSILNFMSGNSLKNPESSMVQRDAISFENGMEYEASTFGNAFALSTKDGIKYYNQVGDQRWSDTYNMISPKMISEGNWIAIADLSGNNLRVYNNNGLQFDIQAKGNILQFALNENGFLSLITGQDGRFGVYVYNNKGVLIKERVEENDGLYPVASDISSDNRSFAVSYIDTSNVVPVSRILFFYINQEDSLEYTDSIFSASVEKNDELIVKINYLDGDILGAVSDKSIYAIGSDGIENWAFHFGNIVSQCDMGNKSYIVLALGNERASASVADDAVVFPKNSVIWLDTTGRVRGEYESTEPIEHITSSTAGIVIGNNNNFIGINHNGKASWDYRSTTDIYDCIPMTTLRDVMLIKKQEAVILEMDRIGQGIIEPIVRIDNENSTIIKNDNEGFEYSEDFFIEIFDELETDSSDEGSENPEGSENSGTIFNEVSNEVVE